MKKKSGFTLIELLAVIVILAILVLLAMPAVTSIMESSARRTFKNEVLGVVKDMETAYTEKWGHGDVESVFGNETKIYTVEKDDKTYSYLCMTLDKLNEEQYMKKNLGENYGGYIQMYVGGDETHTYINITNGTYYVQGYLSDVSEDSYEPQKTNNGTEVTSTTSCPTDATALDIPSNTPRPTYKKIVYLNPKDLAVSCNESNSQIGTGSANASGCMKFYVYDDSGDTYKMILDHNTTGRLAYDTSGTYKEFESATIKTQFDIDTSGWVGNPRLITADEIATITNTTTYDGSKNSWFYFNGTGNLKQTQASTSQGDNEYSWLFDYTQACIDYGCNVASATTSGYWTSSPVSGFASYVWLVRGGGYMSNFVGANTDNLFGIRPVITLSKSQINS